MEVNVPEGHSVQVNVPFLQEPFLWNPKDKKKNKQTEAEEILAELVEMFN